MSVTIQKRVSYILFKTILIFQDQTESNESSQDLNKIVSSVVIACVICLMLGIACYVKKRGKLQFLNK